MLKKSLVNVNSMSIYQKIQTGVRFSGKVTIPQAKQSKALVAQEREHMLPQVRTREALPCNRV